MECPQSGESVGSKGRLLGESPVNSVTDGQQGRGMLELRDNRHEVTS